MKAVFIIFFVSSLMDKHFSQQLTYEEVRALGRDCSPRDTCSFNRTLSGDNLINFLCECKPSCSRYNTCCVDSQNNGRLLENTTAAWRNSIQETCVHIEQAPISIFIKNRCKSYGQYEEEIISLCENERTSLNDPMSVLPVTNPSTSTTYKNYFCALCNNDTEDLVFWNIQLQKLVNYKFELIIMNKYNESKIFDNLVYNNITGEWGFMDTEFRPSFLPPSEDPDSEVNTFRPISLVFEYPSHLRNSITHCEKDLVSECDPNWEDEMVNNYCKSYMSMIYNVVNTSDGDEAIRRFRNIHCAICNFARVDISLPCFIQFSDIDEQMSLSWLLDVNLRDGYRVGEVKGCEDGEKYDLFAKKCRTMMCIKSGYVVKNRKCQPA